MDKTENTIQTKNSESYTNPLKKSTDTCYMRIKVAPGEIIKFESMPTWEEEFDKSELKKRIDAVEMFAINHGFPQWHGQTLLAFIQSLLDQQRKELLGKITLYPLTNKKVDEVFLESPFDSESYAGGYLQAVADLEEIKKSLAQSI